jgi:sugar-specific transcriptional regulator TrmB
MNKQTLITTLEQAGLSEKAAAVYAVLLEWGGMFPSKIATETGIKRSTVYGVLIELSIKGLVSEVEKRGKLFYSAEHPHRLICFGARRIADAKEEYEKLKMALPELEGLFAGVTERPKVAYFEGTKGVMALYDDHIASEKKYEMVGFVNVAELMKFLPVKRYREYARAKERLGITTRGIVPDTSENRAYEKNIYHMATRKPKTLPKVRFVPKEMFPACGDITVYGSDKVSFVTFAGERITGVIVQDATIHAMFRMMFDMAWNGTICYDKGIARAKNKPL